MKGKYRLVTAAVLFSLFTIPAFADETSAVWTRIYDGTESLEGKLSVMRNIIDLHDRAMEPVLTDALKDVIYSRDDSLDITQRQIVDDLTRIIIKELGNLKAVDAAPLMFYVMNNTDDDFLRAAAIAGIGAAGARDYADEIAEILRYTNMEILKYETLEKLESIVDSCIQSLERLKHPVGFEPVFYTATGRYSRRIVSKAERALSNMVEDPTEQLIAIIKSDTPFETRYAALGVEERSKASAEGRTKVANAALEVGLKYNAETPAEKQYQQRLRVKACEMILENAVEDPDSVQWLGAVINEAGDINEIVSGMQALGTFKSDEATAVLSAYLVEHSERRASGILYKDERAIRACINALGNTGNTNAKTALMMVEFSNWSNQTIRMAKSALTKL